MRLSPLVLLICVLSAVIATAALAATPKVKPKVTPQRGTTNTAFKVTFTGRVATGPSGVVNRHYAVEVAKKRASKGCSAVGYVNVKGARSGAKLRATLRPAGKRWCKGRFAGRVYLVSESRCKSKSKVPCARFPSERQQVGRFSVQVR